MKVIVATIWAYPGRPLSESPLKQSCDHFGVPLLVLDQGATWVNSYVNKIVRLLDALRKVDCDVVLYADGDDAFITRDPRPGVLRALEDYQADFIVGAEVVCWPWHSRHYPRFPKVARCNHPNAGVWAATKAGLIREFEGMMGLAAADTDGYEEGGCTLRNQDQALMQEWMSAHPCRMRLDTQERFVLNLLHLDVAEWALFIDLANGRTPPLLHGAGVAKTQARTLWARLQRLQQLARQPRYDLGPEAPAFMRSVNSTDGLVEMLVCLPPLARVVEVGCYRGVSTEALAMFAGTVLAVDLWSDQSIQESFRRRLASYQNVHPLQCASVNAAGWVADASLDLVYIDADHTYTSVRDDLQAWVPKVRRGGFVAGHDYFLDGVARAVDERFGKPDQVFADTSWLVQI